MSTGLPRLLTVLASGLGLVAAAWPATREAALRVRASEATAPCVRAAAEAYRPGPVDVCVKAACTDRADVLVSGAVEMTRFLEGGEAVDGSEVDVAGIPWVLSLLEESPLKIEGLGDLERADVEVWTLAGPAAYEARRVLRNLKLERVRETSDVSALRAAPVALVPLSLASSGRRLAVDVPPIVARAAVAAGSGRPRAARDFVRFLASEAGQRAFCSCAPRR